MPDGAPNTKTTHLHVPQDVSACARVCVCASLLVGHPDMSQRAVNMDNMCGQRWRLCEVNVDSCVMSMLTVCGVSSDRLGCQKEQLCDVGSDSCVMSEITVQSQQK